MRATIHISPNTESSGYEEKTQKPALTNESYSEGRSSIAKAKKSFINRTDFPGDGQGKYAELKARLAMTCIEQKLTKDDLKPGDILLKKNELLLSTKFYRLLKKSHRKQTLNIIKGM